jgi:hypothetical protein
MQIDESDEQFTNTLLSILDNFDSVSNVTSESDPHPWKQPWTSFSTFRGMQIDESDEQL